MGGASEAGIRGLKCEDGGAITRRLRLSLPVLSLRCSHTVKRQTATRSEARQMPVLPRGGGDDLGREGQVSSRRVGRGSLLLLLLFFLVSFSPPPPPHASSFPETTGGLPEQPAEDAHVQELPRHGEDHAAAPRANRVLQETQNKNLHQGRKSERLFLSLPDGVHRRQPAVLHPRPGTQRPVRTWHKRLGYDAAGMPPLCCLKSILSKLISLFQRDAAKDERRSVFAVSPQLRPCD